MWVISNADINATRDLELTGIKKIIETRWSD